MNARRIWKEGLGVVWIGVIALALMNTPATLFAQSPMGTAFSYQGQLKLAGVPVDDTADFEFTLWDADVGGNQVGSYWPVNNVTVGDGLFTVEVDFGVLAFSGEERWLEIDVRSPAEYEEVHIPGSTLIPLGMVRTRTQEIPRDTPVYAFCKTSLRAYEAARYLESIGHDNVHVMQGGVVAWPYETEAGEH